MKVIYTLSCPSYGVFYIGCTKVGRLKTRLREHRKDAKSKKVVTNLKKDEFFALCAKNKEEIQIDELETVTEDDASKTETYWINQFQSWGFDLVNKNQIKSIVYPNIIKYQSKKTKKITLYGLSCNSNANNRKINATTVYAKKIIKISLTKQQSKHISKNRVSGDCRRISNILNISDERVRQCLASGVMRKEIYDVITGYYEI